jgi:hypothetical protein
MMNMHPVQSAIEAVFMMYASSWTATGCTSCDCPLLRMENSHCVASVAAVRDQLRKSNKVRWQEQLSKLLHTMQNASQPASSSYALLFSLQNTSHSPTHPQWKLVPYQMNLNALPTETRIRLESGSALTQALSGWITWAW